MIDAFLWSFWKNPSPSEITSRENSLPTVRDILEIAKISDAYVALEYQVPFNQSRVDCLIFWKSNDWIDTMLLIELKQWTNVTALADEWNFVETYTWWWNRIVPHPSQQIKGYHNYIKNFVSEFTEGNNPLFLFSCAYCHNYARIEWQWLYDTIYQSLINEYPIYSRSDTEILADKIKTLLCKWNWFEIFNRFMQSPVKPSQKLLENVSKVISNEVTFSLLNEQLVAKNLIWSKVRKTQKNNEKNVIIVHWWPWTWKSVIAINILADAAKKWKTVFYWCKSKPFIEWLKKLVWRNWALLFSNLYRFLPSKVKENEIDILLIDEAHRIEKNSNHQYTRSDDRTDVPQIKQLIQCAKTSVFFIDNMQNVRSQEIGSSHMISEAAKEIWCNVSEVTLETQYRCMWSNDYLLRLESILWYTKDIRYLSENEIFDFRVFDSPQEIFNMLKEKEEQKENSARMVAWFCRPRSKDLDENWELKKDVQIWEFAMPWETHGSISRPPTWYVKWYEWAYKPEWFKQVWCIYTAQWFEFDYIWVIIWDDLIYDHNTKTLVTNINATKDPTLKKSKDNFDHHVRNIYRTLLTRGMKWCYIYCTNKETAEYFKSRIVSWDNLI